MEKVREIMKKMKIDSYGVDIVEEKVSLCIDSIQEKDKMKWIQALSLKSKAS